MKKLMTVTIVIALCASMLLCACAAPAAPTTAPSDAPALTDAPAATDALVVTEPVTAQTEPPVSANAAVASDSEPVWTLVDTTAPLSYDFDLDSAMETVEFTTPAEDALTLKITSGDKEYTENFEYFYNPSCYIGNTLTDDGTIELYLMGDEGSDDYTTYVYRIKGGEVASTSVYGTVLNVPGTGDVIVNDWVDIIGTYGAQSVMTLKDGFTFELSSDYLVVEPNWEYYTLTLKRDGFIARRGLDASSETVEFNSGAEFLVIESDLKTFAVLQTRDGDLVYVDVAPNTDEWGFYVNGVSENDWFESVPYSG